jgi:hypothetical protein
MGGDRPRPLHRRHHRVVYEDAEGRQYVQDDGVKVYGMWLPPADEPAVR